MHEGEMAPAVSRRLESQGYRVWVDPDRRSYFDVVARRGREVGLVELKVADWRGVYVQALRRRGFGDWVSVAVPTERIARRILTLPSTGLGARVGVWWVDSGTVHELRAAQRWREPDDPGPFPEQRKALDELLDLLENGGLPPTVEWDGPPGPRRGRRSTREYRLTEFESK